METSSSFRPSNDEVACMARIPPLTDISLFCTFFWFTEVWAKTPYNVVDKRILSWPIKSRMKPSSNLCYIFSTTSFSSAL